MNGKIKAAMSWAEAMFTAGTSEVTKAEMAKSKGNNELANRLVGIAERHLEGLKGEVTRELSEGVTREWSIERLTNYLNKDIIAVIDNTLQIDGSVDYQDTKLVYTGILEALDESIAASIRLTGYVSDELKDRTVEIVGMLGEELSRVHAEKAAREDKLLKEKLEVIEGGLAGHIGYLKDREQKRASYSGVME